MLVAREVRLQLDRGVPPEEILILVPRLDEDAERIRETLLAYRSCTRRSEGGAAGWNDPGRLRAPAGDETTGRGLARFRALVQILRNGQICWSDLDESSTFNRFEAAAAIRATRVFRDRDNIRNALERAARRRETEGSDLLESRLKAIDQLSEVLDSVVGPGPWRVRSIIAKLSQVRSGSSRWNWNRSGMLSTTKPWVRRGLGPAIDEESWSWAGFVAPN